MARRIAVFFYGLFMDVDLLRSKGVVPSPRVGSRLRTPHLPTRHACP